VQDVHRKAVAAGDYRGITSVMVCNEVFHRAMLAEVVERYEIEPKRALRHLKEHGELVTELSKTWKVMNTLRELAYLEIIEVTKGDLGVALRFSKDYGLLSSDAFHAATMKRCGLTDIATNDPDFERVDWLTVWKP
jgi:predicted nucleic acid-binding protein